MKSLRNPSDLIDAPLYSRCLFASDWLHSFRVQIIGRIDLKLGGLIPNGLPKAW